VGNYLFFYITQNDGIFRLQFSVTVVDFFASVFFCVGLPFPAADADVAVRGLYTSTFLAGLFIAAVVQVAFVVFLVVDAEPLAVPRTRTPVPAAAAVFLGRAAVDGRRQAAADAEGQAPLLHGARVVLLLAGFRAPAVDRRREEQVPDDEQMRAGPPDRGFAAGSLAPAVDRGRAGQVPDDEQMSAGPPERGLAVVNLILRGAAARLVAVFSVRRAGAIHSHQPPPHIAKPLSHRA